MNSQIGWEEGDEGREERELRHLIERRYGSLEAYHRRLEAEARAREAQAIEGSMPGALVLGGIWLVVTILKSRRR